MMSFSSRNNNFRQVDCNSTLLIYNLCYIL